MALHGCGPSGALSGSEAALLSALTLTPVPEDPSNAWADDADAAQLGQAFFWDPGFSGPLRIGDDGSNGALGAVGETGRVACASCHDPSAGGTDHRSSGATSLGASWTSRHAPCVVNGAYHTWMFWDGRKDSMWSQALGPIESAAEHNFSRVALAHRIAEVYREPFEASFGALPDLGDTERFPSEGKPGDVAWEAMSPDDQDAIDGVFANFGKAIAAYERRLVDSSSPFDRYMAGDTSAMSDSAVRGAKLFVGRASCNECHNGPTFTDDQFHAIGIEQQGATVPAVDPGRAGGIEPVVLDPFNRAGAHSDAADSAHLDGLVPSEADEGRFKTPTLRNATRTAPYMHTGAYDTLWDVLEYYRFGGNADGPRDAAVRPLALTDEDLHDLIAFLEALEGDPLDPALLSAPEAP